MKMTLEVLNKLIRRALDLIKPEGVKYIDFNLSPVDLGSDDEYYLDITYVVPDDSEFLRSSNMRESDLIRREWNKIIRSTIESYFGVKTIIIHSTGIQAESYYKKQNY